MPNNAIQWPKRRDGFAVLGGPPTRGSLRASSRGLSVSAHIAAPVRRRLSVKHQTQHTPWPRLRGGSDGGANLFLAVVYLPPRGSARWGPDDAPAAAFAALRDHVMAYQSRGRCFFSATSTRGRAASPISDCLIVKAGDRLHPRDTAAFEANKTGP